MPRLLWFLVAVVLVLLGWDLVLEELGGPAGYAVMGVGLGMGIAVLGSLAYDSLAGPNQRL